MSSVDNVVMEVHALAAEFTAGKLSLTEYKELLKDLQSTKVIEAAAGDLAKLSQLNEIINDLIDVASAAS
jgi:hypothetical protein